MEKFAKSFRWQMPLLFVLAFGVWIFCFWKFLSSQISLNSDAISYYDHIKFFVESLSQGIFPLWDPLFNGFSGAPNDFFLRRIGPYNPLYVLMSLCFKLGIPYRLIYLWGMSLYYFSAVIALYLCALRVYQHQGAAFAGSMVLLFSSLGTRIFDSYMILVVVPLIWFFYFLVEFCFDWQRRSFLGLAVCSGILLTTYIPLYFLAFLFIFILIFCCLYWRSIHGLWFGLRGFLHKNWLIVFLSFFVLILSLLPTFMFAKSAQQAQLVIPGRHGNTLGGNQLHVGYNLASDWGIPEDLFFSSYFSNYQRMRFAVLYIPIAGIMIFLLGFVNPWRRTSFLICMTAFILLVVFVPHLFPFHGWLFEHVPGFKYFRNLHFFLWFMLIPLFAFYCADQLSSLKGLIREKRLSFIWGTIVHASFLAWLIHFHDALWSNYFALACSFSFFVLSIKGRPQYSRISLFLFLLVIFIQPVEVYSYMARNLKDIHTSYAYDQLSMKLKFKRGVEPLSSQKGRHDKPSLYVAPYWFNYLYSNVDDYTYQLYAQSRFLVYDQQATPEEIQQLVPHINESQRIEEGENLKVGNFNANQIILKTRFSKDKFLVYNDSYDQGWRAYVNGKLVSLFRANIAFKGVWVPKGDSVVTFQYGQLWQYFLNGFLVWYYSFLLMMIIYSYSKYAQPRRV